MKHLIKFSTLTALLATAAAPGNALADCGSLGYTFTSSVCNDANNRLVCPEDPNKYFCKTAACPANYQTTQDCGQNATPKEHGTIPNCWSCEAVNTCAPAIHKWYNDPSNHYNRGLVLSASVDGVNGTECEITLLRIQEKSLPHRIEKIGLSLSGFNPCEDNWGIYNEETGPTVTDPDNVNILKLYQEKAALSPSYSDRIDFYSPINLECTTYDDINISGEFLWDLNEADYFNLLLRGSSNGHICGKFQCKCQYNDKTKYSCDYRCTSVGTTFLACGSIREMHLINGEACHASYVRPSPDRMSNKALCTNIEGIDVPRNTLLTNVK